MLAHRIKVQLLNTKETIKRQKLIDQMEIVFEVQKFAISAGELIRAMQQNLLDLMEENTNLKKIRK